MGARSEWSADRRRAYNYARNHSPAGIARSRRYALSAKGQARAKRRLWIGHDYAGTAATVEQAAQIQAHIRRRRQEFTKGQRCSAETVGKNKS